MTYATSQRLPGAPTGGGRLPPACQTREIWLDGRMPTSSPSTQADRAKLSLRPAPSIEMPDSLAVNVGTKQGSGVPATQACPSETLGPWLKHIDALLDAAKRGDIVTVRALVPVCDPRAFKSVALLTAAKAGHLAVVRELIPLSDPKANDSAALRWAARNGHLKVVQELIPVSDPRVQNSNPLEEAARVGHLDVVRELIPVSDPKANHSAALCWAARNGHLQMVRELIPSSDPRANDSDPLRQAAQCSRHEVVTVLATVSDAASVFRSELVSGSTDCDIEENVFARLSVAAVDALTPYVGDRERQWAVDKLSANVVEHMPRLKAWREAQALRHCLNEMASRAAATCRPMRRL